MNNAWQLTWRRRSDRPTTSSAQTSPTERVAIMISPPAAPPQLPPPPVWNCGGIVGIDMPTVWWSQEDEGLAITVCINLAVSAGCLVPRATYLHPHHHNPRRLPRSHQPHLHPHRSRSCCSRVCPRSQPPVLTLHAHQPPACCTYQRHSPTHGTYKVRHQPRACRTYRVLRTAYRVPRTVWCTPGGDHLRATRRARQHHPPGAVGLSLRLGLSLSLSRALALAPALALTLTLTLTRCRGRHARGYTCSARAAWSKGPGSQQPSLPPTSRLPSGPERRALAAWVPGRGRCGAPLPAQRRSSAALDHIRQGRPVRY